MGQAYEYRFKMSGLHKVSASVAGQICQQLSDSPEGLTARRLVDVSRDKNAPLHNEFEWDDSIAGEKYREEQAQQLIHHLIIVKSDIETEREIKLEKAAEKESEANQSKDETPYVDRGFVSTGERNARYVPLATALNNEIWRANLLESAKKDSRVFIAKYNRLSELSDVIENMNNFLET